MKTLLVILIVLSFLQATIVPINLILIILISRSLIKKDKVNLYLAFIFGLLASFFNQSVLGLESILYLLIVEATYISSRSRFANNSLQVIPLVIIFLSLNQSVLSWYRSESIILIPDLIWETLLSLPVFYIVKFWEERFIVNKGIKLRV